MDGFPDDLLLSSLNWPEGGPEPRPGELGAFLAQGFGLGAPAIITPYSASDPSFYGFDKPGANPVLGGPTTEEAGGTLYFAADTDTAALATALGVVGLLRTTDYVVFPASSTNPVEERFLDQMRLVSTSALASMFRTRIKDPVPLQSLDMQQAVLAFVAAQKVKWRDDHTYSFKLNGTAGGDGDWAKEQLAFGFHVENTYWGVYRVWSRSWLVTK